MLARPGLRLYLKLMESEMEEQFKKEIAVKATEMADPNDIKRKMLDDLVAQRAAITRKIRELEAEVLGQ